MLSPGTKIQRKPKILISAYACEPGRGSEPGVGWNWVSQIARTHDVWVITRANNRQRIMEALKGSPIPNARWIFFDLPSWLRFWKRQRRGIHLYYYLWQIAAYWHARRLHRKVHFDLVHHVTLVLYWMPSFMAFLPIPFLWGPVGGGDSIPLSFWRNLSCRGKLYELFRFMGQWLSRLDPFLRLTARRAALALGTTNETCEKLRALGCRRVLLCSQLALPHEEIVKLSSVQSGKARPFRAVSVGTLLHLKGFDLSLRAFAEFCKDDAPDAEYWIIGDGPEKTRLQAMADQLGIAGRLKLWGMLPRVKVLEKLAECDVVLHPALHDSGGWASLEGMAAGLPVIGLDAGGTALQITDETGVKLPTLSPKQCVRDLTLAMNRLAADAKLRREMGVAARKRVGAEFSWNAKEGFIANLYKHMLQDVSLRKPIEVEARVNGDSEITSKNQQ